MMEPSPFHEIRKPDHARAVDLFLEHQRSVFVHTSRLFTILLPIQWLAGILAAYMISPLTWHGEQSSINPHLWFAIFVGGAITSLPLFLTIAYPAETVTRHVVAVAQMLMSGLLIHVTDGRIETHFHIFGSLAFLAFYRDWRILISATIVTAADHFFRGWLYPYSMFGIATVDQWRWLEHAGWVIFTDIFLILSCKRNIKEMWEIARRTDICISNEERYRAVVEQTSDGIVLMEPDGMRVIECNEAFSRLLGCKSVDETKTLTAYDFSTSAPEELQELSKVLRETGTPVVGERMYRRRDGSLVAVEISANFISYNDSHAFCLSAKDITERQRAEAEINRLALVAQKTQNAVVITDTEGYVQWVNDGFTRITGFEKNDIVGEKPGKLLQGKDTDPETKAAIREAVRDRRPFEGEIYNYGKDGRGYWLSISIVPIYDSLGDLQGFIAVETEISERKAMEEKLRHAYDDLELKIGERTAELVQTNESMRIEVNERQRAEADSLRSTQFLNTVIDNVPNLIFVKDIEGNFVLANKALADIFGTTADELIGKTDADFAHNTEEAKKFTADDIKLLHDMEETFVPEEQHTDTNGNVHWFQTVKRPVMLGDDGTRYLIGVATDFTERKIMESQLRHSQKLESIGQLAAGIAHEINTPTQYVGDNTRFASDAFNDISLVLNAYRRLLESAETGEVTPELVVEIKKDLDAADLEYLLEEVPNALRQSMEGVSRIAKIVQSMKDFAHPGTKDKQSVDLNRAIESTVTVARNEWKYVAELETNFDTSLPLVPCYLGEFNQVVLNMVINAAHAIGDVVGDGSQGKGKITISTKQVGDHWVEVRIGDTGTGIPKEAQERVFDPFFTTKEVGKGTGQGLAISHTVVVDKHCGQLTFETEPEHGTTFIIRLPLNNFESSDQDGQSND